MRLMNHVARPIVPTLGLVALLLGCLTALAQSDANAQPKPRKIDAGGLTFEVPATWKSETPASSMRRVQLVLPARQGDTQNGELVVFAFPGGAGTVEANIQRWRNQFRNEQGNPPTIDIEQVEGSNCKATVVETAGTFVTRIPEPREEPGFRLLGAIVETKRFGYFIKAIGPDATMTANRPNFIKMVKSMTVSP